VKTVDDIRVHCCAFVLCSAGVEVAAALVGKAKTVTVIDLVEAPFQLALGKEVGNAVRKVTHLLLLIVTTVMMLFTKITRKSSLELH